MTDDEYRQYYLQKLEDALAYQDYVSDRLRKCDPCIIIGVYSSMNYQRSHGESASGIEIKYDGRKADTGNLYIEVGERAKPSAENYTPSGIMRSDNSWLYLIGDYDDAYLFSKHQLKHIYLNPSTWPSRGIVQVELDSRTSKGFLLPITSAMRGLCLGHFVFSMPNRPKGDTPCVPSSRSDPTSSPPSTPIPAAIPPTFFPSS